MLFLGPGRLALAKLEQVLAGQFDAPYRLKDALAPDFERLRLRRFGYATIIGILTVNALVASTHLMVPIQAAYFAIEGTDDLLEPTSESARVPIQGLKFWVVVITLFDKRTNISRDTHGQKIRTVFGEVLFQDKISKNVRLEESPAYKETILTFAPKSPGAVEYKSWLRRYQRVERAGLPVTLKMRHDSHYVESLTSYSGAAIGRMIPVEQVRPNPDQPRKAIGDLRELTIRCARRACWSRCWCGLCRARICYYLISGERRYHAARAAGLREVPCIEKRPTDAETLEIGLIENIQRKDLTAFEEADGLHRLATQFEYTHEDGGSEDWAGALIGYGDAFPS